MQLQIFCDNGCALSGIAQMTHFYITRWGDGGGGQTILEYVLSRRTFSTKQCFSHWAIIVLWFNSWMKVKYHINKSNFFVLNFCTPWTWFFFCLVTIVIMHITLHVIINLQIVSLGLFHSTDYNQFQIILIDQTIKFAFAGTNR